MTQLVQIKTEEEARWTMRALVESTGRSCGECSMCCKLLPIYKREEGGRWDFPFDKPANAWCRHCTPEKGCGVWNSPDFPSLCQTYVCRWKIDREMPEEWRPDKIHAIFDVNVICKFPEEPFLDITLDHTQDIHPELAAFFQEHAGQISYVLRAKGVSLILDLSPEISRAIAEQEQTADDLP